MNNLARYLYSLRKSKKPLPITFDLIPITAFLELEQSRVLVFSYSSALRKRHLSARLPPSRRKKFPCYFKK